MHTEISALGDFKVFAAAKDILEKHIGRSITYDVEVHNDDEYSFYEPDLYWDFEYGEFQYSQEASLVGEFKDCEVYLVHSYNGNKFLLVFDKSNKVEG